MKCVIGYAHWANYIIKGDTRGLDADDIADADAFAAHIEGEITGVNAKPHSSYPACPDGLPLGECLRYYIK